MHLLTYRHSCHYFFPLLLVLPSKTIDQLNGNRGIMIPELVTYLWEPTKKNDEKGSVC